MAGKMTWYRRGNFADTLDTTMNKRRQGKVCAFCGSHIKLTQDVLIRPDLNGLGRNTRAHVSCARKAGIW